MQRVYDAIEEIALDELGLDIYPNQIEMISAEQMLDAYSSVGMPLMYAHWSFGKRFVRDEALYRKGYQALAYEIVINSNPCISYCMEENTHGDADAGDRPRGVRPQPLLQEQLSVPAMDRCRPASSTTSNSPSAMSRSARSATASTAVEQVLDAAHALMDQGVFRYRRAGPSEARANTSGARRERAEYEERDYSDLWRTRARRPPRRADLRASGRAQAPAAAAGGEPAVFPREEPPGAASWQRELLRIVRNVAQYFYPQRQTKLMNEGCATFVHYHIVNRLYDKGLITEGALLEILHSHSNVVIQLDFDDPHYGGINPYALGFAMMQDIQRICVAPTDEDREWFPDIAGREDWRGALRDVWANYRDESRSCVNSSRPQLIRKFKLFRCSDKAANRTCSGRRDPRRRRLSPGALGARRQLRRRRAASPTSRSSTSTSSAIVRSSCAMRCGTASASPRPDATGTLRHIRRLWGYQVRLEEMPAKA